MATVCGYCLCLWLLFVATVCGYCLWPLFVATVCGYRLWLLFVATVFANAEFEEVAKMYRRLSDMNPGAAGSAFELLVHLFWREAAARKDTVVLQLTSRGTYTTEVSVRCAEFKSRSKSSEEHEEMVTLWALHSGQPGYPVLDSILRYKSGDKIEVLAIQISLAKQHRHDKPDNMPRLLTSCHAVVGLVGP